MPKWNKSRCLTAFLAILCLFALPAGVEGQSKKSLEEKRRRLLKEIETTDKLLRKTTQSKEAAYDRYITLQKLVEQRQNLIGTLEAEIVDVDNSIGANGAVIQALQRDYEVMRQEYAKMVRYGYRRKMMSNPLLYILSAESLNEAFRRWLFLRKYDRFRREQARAIAATQNMLARKIEGLEQSKVEKETLLADLERQKNALSSELGEKDKLLKTLARNEEQLKKELAQKQAAHEQLNQAIERIIQEEVRKQMEASREPAIAAPSTPPSAATPSKKTETKSSGSKAETKTSAPETNAALPAVNDEVSRNFGLSRGKLPWPVESGFISRGFGRQRHPTIQSVEITNNGIDIRTEDGAPVMAVYEGKVAGVQFIPGHDYTVILQHGQYYTVYSNLAETNLSKGDWVKSKQPIGRVSTNAITGSSELHFELWFQKERQNPAVWIKK